MSRLVGFATVLALAALPLTSCKAGDNTQPPATRASASVSTSTSTSTSARASASASASSAVAPLTGRLHAPALQREAAAQLSFSWHGEEVAALSKAQLLEVLRLTSVVAFDPYYNKQKRFAAVPLRDLLTLAFKGRADQLEQQHFVLKAVDGYTVTIEGKQLLQDGGYLALADLEVPEWQAIGPQQANPGPYYLIWSKPDQQDLKTHPRPWQLASIGVARFEDTFPHTLPGAKDDRSAAWRGFTLFREQCIRCHAINREGGRVGPELNVPQSIVEYRPRPQIRAYIRNPLAFRYGNMPQNPHLNDSHLDDLLAYFDAMKERKHDTSKAGAAH